MRRFGSGSRDAHRIKKRYSRKLIIPTIRIVHLCAPKVFMTDVAHFSSLVQHLTGNSSSTTAHHSPSHLTAINPSPSTVFNDTHCTDSHSTDSETSVDGYFQEPHHQEDPSLKAEESEEEPYLQDSFLKETEEEEQEEEEEEEEHVGKNSLQLQSPATHIAPPNAECYFPLSNSFYSTTPLAPFDINHGGPLGSNMEVSWHPNNHLLWGCVSSLSIDDKVGYGEPTII